MTKTKALPRDTEALVRRCEVALRWAAGQNRTYLAGAKIRVVRPLPHHPECCPVVLACSPEQADGLAAGRAGGELGYLFAVRYPVISAADNAPGADYEIRQRLLIAAGLAESSTGKRR